MPSAALRYLAEAPEFAAPQQAGGDLAHAALRALVRVGGQLLQVRPQQRQEGVAVVAEQPLWTRGSVRGRSAPRMIPLRMFSYDANFETDSRMILFFFDSRCFKPIGTKKHEA